MSVRRDGQLVSLQGDVHISICSLNIYIYIYTCMHLPIYIYPSGMLCPLDVMGQLVSLQGDIHMCICSLNISIYICTCMHLPIYIHQVCYVH
jgi:hypothetical protein